MLHNIAMTRKTRALTVRDALRAAKDLDHLDAEVLLAHVLKKDRAWLLAHSDYSLPTTRYSLFRKLVRRRRAHEPLAYIIGTKDFYKHTFVVNRHTLIPRPESEMLVDLAVGAHALRQGPIWDVGTGSGAIAISIAKEIPTARVLATDISSKALAVAQRNATRLKAKNVRFFKADLVPRKLPIGRILGTEMPVIVANLPYLPISDKKRLDHDVVTYEPTSALFAGKDGLALIKKFLRQITASKIPFSSLFLEYDPPQTKTLRLVAKKSFPKATIRIHKDLARRDRVMEISTRP